MWGSTITVFFINNDGAGFADNVTVKAGTTIGQFFGEKCPGREPSDYMIRLNGAGAAASTALKNGDKVTFAPKKVTGA